MDSTSPTPPPSELVTQDINCQICGRSVRGLPVNGDCPNCKTPVALSVVEQIAPMAMAVAPASDDVLVAEDRLCVKCRHNLRGLPAEGFCPECRTRIRESAPVEIVSGQKVTEDRPCLVCGYNLKGIETEANCPECGTPAARSLRGFLLRYSSPDYVASLRRGMLLIEASLILAIVVGVASVVLSIVFASMGMSMTSPTSPVPLGTPTPMPTGAGRHQMFQTIAQLVGTLLNGLSLWGWWMFSSPDPALTTQDPGDKSRRLLRTYLVISAATACVSLVFEMIPDVNAPLAPIQATVVPITPSLLAGGVGVVAWIVGFIATMTYMGHLARRVPDASLHLKSKRNRWMLPVVGIGGIVLCYLGPLIALIMYITFIDEWRKRLKALSESIMLDDLAGVART